MMIYVVLIFLWTSILIYLLMGGADYGAGILELFSSNRDKPLIRKRSYQVMGPVWEANHMWLIIAVVILFVGFPGIYAALGVWLHIPLLLLLMGIVARGTSFTFRNYDAVQDGWQRVYSKVYVYSSFMVPFFLGNIAGAAVSGRINPLAGSFLEKYIFSWLNWFCFFTGCFTVFLCGFIAAVFLTGETETGERAVKQRYRYGAALMNSGMVVCFFLICFAASKRNIALSAQGSSHYPGIVMIVCAAAACCALWYAMIKDEVMMSRVFAGLLVITLMLTVTLSYYPFFVVFKDGTGLSVWDMAAPVKTMRVLGSALLIGSAFIIPSLCFLVYSFDKKSTAFYAEDKHE